MSERPISCVYDDLIAEGIHVAFRKASDHPAASRAWHAINDLPDDEWAMVIAFILDGARVEPPK